MPEPSALLASEHSFEEQTFVAVDAQSMDLSSKEFSCCTFRQAKLQESRWTRARLEDCVFDSCDLTRVQALDLVLRGVELRHCKLMGIDWSKLGTYPDVSFVECNLQYAVFGELSLRKTRFERCV